MGREQHLSIWQARLTVNSTKDAKHSFLSSRYHVAGISYDNIQMSDTMMLGLKNLRVLKEFLSPGWYRLNTRHSLWPLWTVS